MKILQRVWNEIWQGENIDLYITIFVAIVLAVLNLVGPTLQSHLAPVTLAVLALLAVTSLGNRYRIDKLLGNQSRPLDGFYQEEYPESYKEDFESAKELWLVGVSLHRTIQNNYSWIEQKLQQGHRFRILLVHPEGPGIELAIQRNYVRREVEPKRHDITYTLQLLCDLQSIPQGELAIRTIQYPVAYGVTAVDPDSAAGVLYIEHYCFRLSSEAMPKFVLRASDGRWYGFFRDEIRALWDAGTEWSCKGSMST